MFTVFLMLFTSNTTLQNFSTSSMNFATVHLGTFIMTTFFQTASLPMAFSPIS